MRVTLNTCKAVFKQMLGFSVTEGDLENPNSSEFQMLFPCPGQGTQRSLSNIQRNHVFKLTSLALFSKSLQLQLL